MARRRRAISFLKNFKIFKVKNLDARLQYKSIDIKTFKKLEKL